MSSLGSAVHAAWSAVSSQLGPGGDPAGAPQPDDQADDRRAEVFPQSVASGDPTPRGAVLWTRVDLAALGAPGSVEVSWTVAADPGISEVLLSGTTTTDAHRDGTVKVRVDDPRLQPATHYWYRFEVGATTTRTGRMRTLPAADATLDRLTLGYTSCQDWTNGYFTALGALADQDLDHVLHLGDYVYETTRVDWQGTVREISLPSGADAATTLEDYRHLYRTYKTDPHLQRCHEQHTWLVIWDDHEFTNDGWGDHASGVADPPADPERRAAANRAWAEFLPTACLLTSGDPTGGLSYDPSLPATQQLRLYREVRFGTLAHLFFTDERLFRDGHACGETRFDKYLVVPCDEVFDPSRTMLGAEQREWLVDGLLGSGANWKLWGNETMVMGLRVLDTHLQDLLRDLPDRVRERLREHVPAGSDVLVDLDQWDGYQAERTRIAQRLLDGGITDLVTLTGDLHSSVAGWFRSDFDAEFPADVLAALDDEPASPPARGDLVGTCFMSTSVTAANLSTVVLHTVADLLDLPFGARELPDFGALGDALERSNPHLALFSSETHGFNVAEFTPTEMTVTYWVVEDVTDRDDTSVRVDHRFAVARQSGPEVAPLIRRLG